MSDLVSPNKRSEIMSGIKSKDTKPELIVRKGLFKRGFRYRLHYKGLPGKPDLVFLKYKAIIFVNGCFWHGHDCKNFKWPKSNSGFWKKKITDTQKRDIKNLKMLTDQGWRVTTIWECALRGKTLNDIERKIDTLSVLVNERK